MENQFKDVELFEGKNLSDVFQDIYQNHISKKDQIKNLIGDLTPLIEGIGDATLLVPLIKEYLEISVKNDEQLVKLAQIVQRIESSKKTSSDSGFGFDDLQLLLEQDNEIKTNIEETSKDATTVLKDVPASSVQLLDKTSSDTTPTPSTILE